MDFERIKGLNATQPDYGFAVHSFLEAFNETFYKSCRSSFSEYFKEHDYIRKWMVFSDYVLHDKNKANDAIVFSIVPYLFEFDDFSSALNSIAPRDLKKTKAVDNRFVRFLETGPALNIGVILNKKRRMHSDEKHYYAVKFEMMKRQLQQWCLTTPDNAVHYNEFIGSIDVLKEVVAGPGANMKVIRDIEVLSTLAGYLMFEMSRLVDVETIGWFSDRDSMLSFKAGKIRTPFILDMAHHLYYLFCNSEGIESERKLVLGVPENGPDGKVWYDSFNRIPDFIAGTLADYEYKKNSCSHDKYIPIIERVLTAGSRNLFFSLDISNKGYFASRLEFSRCDGEPAAS